jgi:O-antigen chain-terminating methyltransferase
MRDRHEVDVEQILDAARQQIARRNMTEASAAAPAGGGGRGQAATDFSHLHAAADVQNVPFASHRPIMGAAVVAVKKALRQLLTPILERQVAYNTASALAMTQLRESLAVLDLRQSQMADTITDRLGVLETDNAGLARQLNALSRAQQEAREAEARQSEALRATLSDRDDEQRATLAALEERVRRDVGAVQDANSLADRQALQETEARLAELLRALESRIDGDIGGLWDTLGAMRREGREARERVSRAERKLRRILHAMDGDAAATPERLKMSPVAASVSRADVEPPFDYAGFEERFRGVEEDIKERQKIYVPYFTEAQGVLDIGCGRGEFLDLLRDAGIAGRGVDADLDMVLLCREKGLDAEVGEAFAALEAVEDGALGGVFGAQIIEHLPPARVIELVRLCARKLASNGVLVLETPNPRCLTIFAESFYMDPSHQHPLHPDTMQYLLDAAGFRKTALRFSAPVDPASHIPPLAIEGADLDAFNRGMARLNDLLFGAQDFAVIGWKSPIAGRQGLPAEPHTG